MSVNKYKQATKFYKIPVLGWKDGIWPEVEMKKWQIVENLLLAANKGNTNAIFREGDLRVNRDVDGETFKAQMSATGNDPSLQGTVGGAFFNAPLRLEWKGLRPGFVYFLYIRGSSKTFLNEKDVVTISSPVRATSPNSTLVAKVDLTGDKVIVDRMPPGKVNSRNLAKHVLDTDNPHGDKLTQDEMLIRNRLVIGDNNDVDIEVDVNGDIKHFPVSKLVSVLEQKTEIVDFKSSGIKKGITLKFEGEVISANVVRTNQKDAEAGEIIIGFYGLHKSVKESNKIMVWNTGESGVNMRATIVSK